MTTTTPSLRLRARRRLAGLAAPAALVLAASLPLAAPATAAPVEPTDARAAAAPRLPATVPATVSADALPTVQVDGVVWAQVIVGKRVYVTGSFSAARPAGAARGQEETPRANLLAYDLETGELVSSWAPRLNAQGLAIAASPDGSRVYVGGDFTTANGARRERLVALDAATGALVDGFAPRVNARVRAVTAVGSAVYAGGSFTTSGGQARTRLAAFRAADGALTPWAPAADREVFAIVAPPGAGTLVVGGRFTRLGGASSYGLGAVTLASGVASPFAANKVVRNAGSNAAIYALSTDGARVYGAGYVYGPGGNLENTFAADARTGALAWVNGCRGDTYDVAPAGGVLYTVGHPHQCSAVGAFPETRPRQWQRAQAMTAAPSPRGRKNTSGAFSGRPASELLHWLPSLDVGKVTGQSQAAWAIDAADGYVVLGGEFPRVNGSAQQGLVRFRARDAAPHASGPIGYAPLAPAASVTGPGAVSLRWTSAWDRDDAVLTYEVLRASGRGPAEVVAVQDGASSWWKRPALSAEDAGAPAGEVTYRVRVSDPDGNTMTSTATTVTVAAGAPGSPEPAPTPTPTPPVAPEPPEPPVGPDPPQPPAPSSGASDAFSREAAASWGAADVGGPWSLTGPASAFAVRGGEGTITVAPRQGVEADLAGVSVQDVDASVTLSGTVGSYAALVVRRVDAGTDYRLQLRGLDDGSVGLSLRRRSGGVETVLSSTTLAPGTTGPGEALRVRVVAVGSGSSGPVTQLRAAAWPVGGASSAAPSAWALAAQDAAPELAAPGGVGVAAYRSGLVEAGATLGVDDLAVGAGTPEVLTTP